MIPLATFTPAGEPQAFDLPLLTRLMPGLVSAIALLPASMALEFHGVAGVLMPLLIIQGSLLVLGTVTLVLGAHDRLSQWERWAAPQRARHRVRTSLFGDLWRMGAIGMAGPLALAFMLTWRGDGWMSVSIALMVPVASLCCALTAALSWLGRAPRLLLLPALAVLVVVLGWPAGAPLGGGGALVATAAAAVLLASWLASGRALVCRARPLPWPRPLAWLRRTAAYQAWRITSGLEPTATPRPGGERYTVAMRLLLPLLWLPQLVGQGDRLRWFGWGQAFDGAMGGLAYGGCMLLVTLIAAGCDLMPSLHWRRRLAPRGMSSQRWAVRKVLGSMGSAAALFSVALGLIWLFRGGSGQGVDVSTWLVLMGDVLLASSFVQWHLGRRFSVLRGLAVVLGAAGLLVGALYGLQALYVSPQRGALWLAVQLLAAALLARAAMRAYGGWDLNRVS